jgi:uncharacterized Fe-S cluster protein YjdI
MDGLSVPFLDATRDGNSQMYKHDCDCNDVGTMEIWHATVVCTHAGRNVSGEPLLQNMVQMLHSQ